MFSAIGPFAKRRMTVTLVLGDGREFRIAPDKVTTEIPLGGEMSRYRNELLNMPSRPALERLTKRLAQAEWVAITHPNPHETGRDGSDQGRVFYRMKADVPAGMEIRRIVLRSVKIEIWQYRFNHDSNTLKLGLLTGSSLETGRWP